MKLRKAMAVALAGALVLTTIATGTTSEAAKKTKLKTKKVSIFVKGKKKISITGKKAKHKYTFTSKKKKIAKVSKKGVITGVKAGKTTITVKDTWKQKGKKKTKKLGTVKVTVKAKTPVVKPTQKPVVTPPVQAPVVTPAQTPVVTPPAQTPDGGSQTPVPSVKPSAKPSIKPSTKPSTAPTEKPIPTPDVEMSLEKNQLKPEDTTTATVSVSAGEVNEVTWSVEKADVASAVKDAQDAKKAVITGKAAGETKITATVKVTVEEKEFTLKAESSIKVAAVVVNPVIESDSVEVNIGEKIDLAVKVDVETSMIESIVWDVEGDIATVETDAVDITKVTLTGVTRGKGKVTVTVTVKQGDETATNTATVNLEVIQPIIEVDLSKGVSTPSWFSGVSGEAQKDGSYKITWAADADKYGSAKFNFDDGMDLTGYYCVIDAEGCISTVEIHDKEKHETIYNNPYSVTKIQYGKTFPFVLQLSPDNLNTAEVSEGGTADYTNVGGVQFAKGEETEELVLTVKSIKFYKYEKDIPANMLPAPAK